MRTREKRQESPHTTMPLPFQPVPQRPVEAPTKHSPGCDQKPHHGYRYWVLPEWGTPHASGDQPLRVPDSGGPRMHAPREWGSTLILRSLGMIGSARPTRVGINPGPPAAGSRHGGTPHASGDQPFRGMLHRCIGGHAPREWGSTLLRRLPGVCGIARPTRVGINRS